MLTSQTLMIGVFVLVASALVLQLLKTVREKFINEVNKVVDTPNVPSTLFPFATSVCGPQCCIDGSNTGLSCSRGCICKQQQL